jgi:hypothetical protein
MILKKCGKKQKKDDGKPGFFVIVVKPSPLNMFTGRTVH